MTRSLRRALIGAVLLALLGCEAPGTRPVPPSVRWGLERFDVQQASVPASLPPQSPGVPASYTPAGTPSPSATLTPGSGGGSSHSAPAGPPRGRVFAYADRGLTPFALTGATVWTTDGRSATTDAEGRFALTGAWPADGTWVVVHPSYHASTVVGLVPDGPLEFHLKSNTVVPGPTPPDGKTSFEIAGRVVDRTGAPVEGVTLLMNAKDGSFGTPAFTALDGTFTMKVLAHGDTVEDAAVVAIDYDTEAWMGLATGLTLDKAVREVDLAPGDAGTGLVVTPMTHTLRLNVVSAPADLRVRSYVDLVVPGLEPIAIYGHDETVRLTNVPGARYNVRVYAADSERTRQTAYVREQLAPDFRNPETALDIALLPIPEILPLAAGPLTAVSWNPIAGASGYEVRLDSENARGFQWEGYTTATSLPFNVPDGTPSGNYALKVTAWEAAGMTPRRVASFDQLASSNGNGPAALRVLPDTTTYRFSISERHMSF